MPARSNIQIAALLAARIREQVRRSAAKGLDAARVFLTSRVRETVSIPAPRRIVTTSSGARYYVAKTRAIQGAPPRKLSGKLRQSIWSRMLSPTRAVIGANARSIMNFNYPAYLETTPNSRRRHAFIEPTVRKYQRELKQIVGGQLRLRIGGP